MSSKRKLNGCTTVRCVERAIRTCGCSTKEFFRRALNANGPISDFYVDLAVKRFTSFKEHRPAGTSTHYEILIAVSEFAADVLRLKRQKPTIQKNRTRSQIRPSISMGIH